jgi:hypothetical protein
MKMNERRVFSIQKIMMMMILLTASNWVWKEWWCRAKVRLMGCTRKEHSAYPC